MKSKLSTAKKSKTTTFSRVFHPKKIDNFLEKLKLNFWTKNENFELCDLAVIIGDFIFLLLFAKKRFFSLLGSKVKILGHKVGALFRKSVRVRRAARIPFDFGGFWHPIVVTEDFLRKHRHTRKKSTTPTTQEILLH